MTDINYEALLDIDTPQSSKGILYELIFMILKENKQLLFTRPKAEKAIVLSKKKN